jgi:DNA-binding NarL/FixJ family response regulator
LSGPILVVDDHPIVLAGCRRVLEDAGLGPVVEAATIARGYRLFCRLKPRLSIVDLSMRAGGLDGLRLVQRIRRRNPDAAVLVLTMHRDPAVVTRALEMGANGYLLKDTAPDELVAAAHAVLKGRPYLSHGLATEVVLHGARRRRAPRPAMTPREAEILELLADGKSYGLIAEELAVSYKTVANTASQLKTKLGVSTLPELVHAAMRSREAAL